MRMIEMDELFANKGFSVDRTYNSITDDYLYTIAKDEVSVSEKFKYRGEQSQINFIRRLIERWERFYSANKPRLEPYNSLPEIRKVIFNDPATIVLWSDGTKTVVKCQDGDIFDPEKGLAMAISKKAMGNKGNYCNEIKKWTETYEHDMTYPEIPKINLGFSKGFLDNFKKAAESAINAANKFAEATAKTNEKSEDK